MTQEELSEALEGYKEGLVNWVELAKLFEIASSLSLKVDGNLISLNRFKEITRAYPIIKEFSLEEDPRIHKVSIRVLAYLPFIRTLVDEEHFKKIMKEALNGKITGPRMEQISMELQGKSPMRYDNFRNIKNRIINLTEDLSDYTRYPEMRKHIAKECSELAQRLNCIIDEKYYKLWLEREEFKI